jgi:hypothetical protein
VIFSVGFFATGAGLLTISLAAALIIIAWDWRVALVSLWFIQIGVVGLSIDLYSISMQWALAEILVMLLCCLILAISRIQAHSSRSERQAGNWLLRTMGLALLFIAWRLLDPQIILPILAPNVVQFFTLLSISALLIIALGDNPLFTGVTFLLWLMVVQVIVSVLLPLPVLVALIGSLQLLLALSCGYLVLADRVPKIEQQRIATDITFPDTLPGIVRRGERTRTTRRTTPTGLGAVLKRTRSAKRSTVVRDAP